MAWRSFFEETAQMLTDAALKHLKRKASRAKIYSVRFFVGFLGSAAAAPLVSTLYERTGSVVAATSVLAVFSVVTLGCALFFSNRKEELQPELWADALPGAAE
jgi:hypothetical protein